MQFFYASSLVFDFKRFHLDEEEKRSLAERVRQRRGLNCHNFEWYLYNVIPEMEVESSLISLILSCSARNNVTYY